MMKLSTICICLAALAAAACGCRERGSLTLLFTSDVNGWIEPAG